MILRRSAGMVVKVSAEPRSLPNKYLVRWNRDMVTVHVTIEKELRPNLRAPFFHGRGNREKGSHSVFCAEAATAGLVVGWPNLEGMLVVDHHSMGSIRSQ